MKLFTRMVVVAAVVVVLMNMDSIDACRVLNTNVQQKGTLNPPQISSIMKQMVQRGLNYEGTTDQGLQYVSNRGIIYVPSIIRQRLQKGTVPSTGGNPGTNVP